MARYIISKIYLVISEEFASVNILACDKVSKVQTHVLNTFRSLERKVGPEIFKNKDYWFKS